MPATLFTYMKETQKLIHDQKQMIVNPADIIDYVNRARREVAMRSQCLRVLPPISGAIVNASVTAQGSGYTAPTVTISAPDFPSGQLPYPNGLQAVGTSTLIAGAIDSVNIISGGSGYFEPTITITDPTGTGCTVEPVISFVNEVNIGQEGYPFSSVDLSASPGIASIYLVRSVSIIYSNYRYSLPMYSFSIYQAMIRQYPFQYQWVPTVGSQFGQGTSGSFFLYPLPSQPYQMEWDCSCLPSDLTSDQDYEAIPDPWTDAVPFFAAHRAFLEMQNWNSARGMLDLFDQFMHRYGSYTRSGRATNPYGRWIWLALSVGLSAALSGGC